MQAGEPTDSLSSPAQASAPDNSLPIEHELNAWVDSVDLQHLAAAAPRDSGRFYFGGGASLLPGVGLSAHAGWAFARGSSAVWSLEAEGGWQFLDDEAFIDDGRPAAGDWLQARLGLRVILSPDRPRRVVLRGGAAFKAAFGVLVGTVAATVLKVMVGIGIWITLRI